ncbi:mitochondrial carrier [Aspergillus sclerotioniger CBS 115572]|uniref:Mitochondrial carrier n=1 Tax=Aspergillus sclerotioniger CBS 115572 TaxID=1450535 RepID=A0A317VVX3_9EURO|nr:mitochondrial carrier [Aspergillus sclerotioniger CBS 115572]PWY76070.1 mitochondrial carrier [Aspergillus sclerotioniger CBS 115572]
MASSAESFTPVHTAPGWKQNVKDLVAGAAGGVAQVVIGSILSGPIEHIRIRLQTQPKPLYTGPLHCALTLLHQGGLPALYRGQTATLLREGHGIGVWFATYEGCLSLAAKQQSLTRETLPTWEIAVCGALAGEMLWLLSHPFDVVKSRMQSDGFGHDRRWGSFRGAVSGMLRDGGMWRGLGTALCRAGPVSGGTFVV